MATVTKRCGCARGVKEPQGKRTVWNKCSHSWVVRWQVNGRQAEESYPPHERREADAKAKTVESEKVLRSGVDPQGAKTTVRELVTEWIADRPGPESTTTAYMSVARNWIFPEIERRPVASVRREDVQKIFRRMRANVGESRQASAYLVLNGAMREALHRRWILDNPCTAVKPPKGAQERDFVIPTAEQFAAVVARVPADWQLSIWLMYGCGLRPGEALAVHERGVRGGRLRITEQLIAWPNDQLGPLKHRVAREFREVPLPTALADEIDRHIKLHDTIDGYLFRGARPEQPARRYRHPTRQAWREGVQRGIQDAGLPETFTPHWFRHAFATEHLLTGTSLFTVSRWLGHKNIQTTADTYGHLVPSEWVRGAELMDGSLRQLMENSGDAPDPPGTDGN